jgi:hypothetical protein
VLRAFFAVLKGVGPARDSGKHGVRGGFGKLRAVPAPVAQGIEHGSPKAGVACSNHAGGTTVMSQDIGIALNLR